MTTFISVVSRGLLFSFIAGIAAQHKQQANHTQGHQDILLTSIYCLPHTPTCCAAQLLFGYLRAIQPCLDIDNNHLVGWKNRQRQRGRGTKGNGDGGSRITISVDAVFAIAFLHIANYLVDGWEGVGAVLEPRDI